MQLSLTDRITRDMMKKTRKGGEQAEWAGTSGSCVGCAAKRFYPDESAAEVEYTQFASRLCLMVLTPEQITGKMGLELMQRKEQAQ